METPNVVAGRHVFRSCSSRNAPRKTEKSKHTCPTRKESGKAALASSFQTNSQCS